MSNVAAFIDFDGTLLSDHTANFIGKYLKKSKSKYFCDKRLSLFYFIKLLIVKKLTAISLMRSDKFEEVLFEFYKGCSKEAFLQWTKGFYTDYLKEQLAPAMMEKLDYHRKKVMSYNGLRGDT